MTQEEKVKAYDLLQDKEILIKADGYLAIVLQHELDHFKGVLFYDHINQKDPFYQDPDALSQLFQPLFPALHLWSGYLLHLPDLPHGGRRDKVYPPDRGHASAGELRRQFYPVHTVYARNG